MKYSIEIICDNEDGQYYVIEFEASNIAKVSRCIDSYIPKKGYSIVNINVQGAFTLV